LSGLLGTLSLVEYSQYPLINKSSLDELKPSAGISGSIEHMHDSMLYKINELSTIDSSELKVPAMDTDDFTDFGCDFGDF
jgi:hypothetical protein